MFSTKTVFAAAALAIVSSVDNTAALKLTGRWDGPNDDATGMASAAFEGFDTHGKGMKQREKNAKKGVIDYKEDRKAHPEKLVDDGLKLAAAGAFVTTGAAAMSGAATMSGMAGAMGTAAARCGVRDTCKFVATNVAGTAGRETVKGALRGSTATRVAGARSMLGDGLDAVEITTAHFRKDGKKLSDTTGALAAAMKGAKIITAGADVKSHAKGTLIDVAADFMAAGAHKGGEHNFRPGMVRPTPQ